MGIASHRLSSMQLPSAPLADDGGGHVLMCAQGVFAVQARDGYWVVPPGTVLYLGPGQQPRVRHTRNLHLTHVVLDAALVQRMPACGGLVVASPLMRELIESLASPGGGRASPRDSRAGLLADLLRATPSLLAQSLSSCVLKPVSEPRLDRICRHVLEHLEAPRTLHEWALELALDPRTLHRLFVREFGMSFVQWRQQARLMAALEWLAAGRAVMDVALDLGYQTQSAFSAMFRRHMGITPSQWQLLRRRAEDQAA